MLSASVVASALRGLMRRRHAWPVMVMAVGSLATAVAAAGSWRAMDLKGQDRFLQEVEQTHVAIQDRMETYVAVLRATAALFAASDNVTRAEFAAFATRLNLPERYPGIQGIGFSAHVSPDEVERLEADMHRQGLDDFRIWPDGPRSEIHSIVFLEPLDSRNKAAIGFDMATDAVRRAAMELARDSGEPAASGKVRLVQEIGQHAQAGFLIYVPVYRGRDVPDTVEERRRLLLGHAYAPFRADDLLGKLLGGVQPSVAVEIHDGDPAAGAVMHRSAGWSVDGAAQYRTERPLEVAGRHWTVAYAAEDGLDSTSGRELVWVVAAGGLLATGMVSAAAWAQARARVDAERASAAERLRAQELETINKVGSEVSAQLDLDQLVQSVTDGATRLAGAQVGAFFYNVVDERGEAYTLHALSGPGSDMFAGFPMPRNTALFSPTFRGETTVRSDDITQDPRYGHNAPHRGMPPGHPPVRSYLAVPVISRSGETLGGIILGHGEPGVFTAHVERLVVGLAAQAAVAVDNARLFGTVQKQAEHRKLLINELNHRVKNTLAAVQSIARQTSRSCSTPAAFVQSFEGRLLALSNAHNLLTRGNWEGAPLVELAQAELAPYGRGRAVIDGPAVWLPPQDAVALGMAFHELATNAAKYGALSVPDGQVRLGWSIVDETGECRLTVRWEEVGGPPVTPPARRGFGSQLIGAGLANQLDGNVTLDFPPAGARCVIDFPFARKTTR